jgi:hypothetical protein
VSARLRALARGALAALGLAGALASPAAARIVVFGVDGGSWSLLDPGMRDGSLPNFRALAERGVSAEMETVSPVISPTVWTSIATGRSPDAHGITDFTRNRTHVRVPTVFERLARRGLHVGLEEWLVTDPPRSLPGGFVIPGWTRRDDRLSPPDVFERAGVAPYLYSVKRFRTQDDFVANARSEVREKPLRFNRLAQAFGLDVGAVVFYSADATGHRFWRAAFPDEFDEPRREADDPYRGVVVETLRGLDAALGSVVSALGPEDSILVLSDHGFEAGETRPVWSARLTEQLQGSELDPADHAFTIDGEFSALMLRVHPGPFAEREPLYERLAETLRSARTEGGATLFRVYLADVAERPSEARRGLFQRILQWGFRLYLRLAFGLRLDRPAYGYVFAVPDDAVLRPLWPDGRVTILGRTLAVSEWFQLDDFSGAHDETAIFLAGGPAFRPQAPRGEVSVLDVAPLLLHLAGQPVPDDLEGRVPSELLDPAYRAAHPVTTVPADALPGLPPEAADASEDDAVLLERLRALGYAQ